jgi:hypothetical protein
MPKWLEYFCRIYTAREFTDEYSFNLHWHMLTALDPSCWL